MEGICGDAQSHARYYNLTDWPDVDPSNDATRQRDDGMERNVETRQCHVSTPHHDANYHGQTPRNMSTHDGRSPRHDTNHHGQNPRNTSTHDGRSPHHDANHHGQIPRNRPTDRRTAPVFIAIFSSTHDRYRPSDAAMPRLYLSPINHPPASPSPTPPATPAH